MTAKHVVFLLAKAPMLSKGAGPVRAAIDL
jgi:hypothetical protein